MFSFNSIIVRRRVGIITDCKPHYSLIINCQKILQQIITIIYLALNNNYSPLGRDNLDKHDTWCTVSVNDVKTTVLVRHFGRGKFKVIDDRSGGSLIGKIIDASDIYHC